MSSLQPVLAQALRAAEQSIGWVTAPATDEVWTGAILAALAADPATTEAVAAALAYTFDPDDDFTEDATIIVGQLFGKEA